MQLRAGITAANFDNGSNNTVSMQWRNRWRSVAIELHENAKAIEAWRATLPERERRRLIHPLSNVRRWRPATQSNGQYPQDLKREAAAAWRRFVTCVSALPPVQAAPLWHAALSEATR
jgi:hypothetical protein